MNVLKCEFIKLKKSIAFKVTWLITLCFSVLYGFMVSSSGDEYNGLSLLLNAFSDNMLYIIIGSVIAGLFICNDFENRTFQESITCGNSHLSVIASKAFVYTLSMALACIPYPVISGAIVAAKYGWGFETVGVSGVDFAARMALLLVSIFFAYLPIMMFFVMVCFLVHKTGISFAINMPAMMIGTIVLQMIQKYLFPQSEIYAKIYGYSFPGLPTMPFVYLNEEALLVDVTLNNYLPIIIAGTVWSVLLFTTAAVTFKKRDLK
ncbi:MAG: ABC transporter permease [Acutalibacteraceae bacterium]